MEINYIRTSGWQAAFRGMRNPKNSWNKSDSVYGLIHSESKKDIIKKVIPSWVKSMNTDYHYAETVLNNNGVLQEMNDISEVFFIGGADMKLAKSLIKAGSEHRKLLRQIFITFDITAPLYFFKEFDTYKINTTSNSTSTMHTIEKKEITLSSFEVGDYNPDLPYITGEVEIPISSFVNDLIECFNFSLFVAHSFFFVKSNCSHHLFVIVRNNSLEFWQIFFKVIEYFFTFFGIGSPYVFFNQSLKLKNIIFLGNFREENHFFVELCI